MRRIVLFGLLGILAAFTWFFWSSPKSLQAPDAGKRIPVQIAPVDQRDMPLLVDAVGTVQAFNSVLVRSRVDGQLEKVTFTEGQQVKLGDLLAQLDARPAQALLRLAAAQKAKDAVQLANAERDLARYSELSHRGAVPQQALDTTRSQVDQLKAALEADNAQIDNVRLQVDYTTIRAPISGRVGARLIDAGNMVHASDVAGLVSIVQTHPISIGFSIPQDVLPALQARQRQSALRVTARSRDGSQELGSGELTLIDNQIDATSGTIHCKATFENPESLLWPGQFVNVAIALDTTRNALVVPSSAVQLGVDGAYVFVVTSKETAELRRVEVVSAREGITTISRGVAAGERVVVQGQFKLESGTPVRIVDQLGATSP